MSRTRPRCGRGVPVTDRVGSWLLTGPIGRVVGFALELAIAWWSWVRTSLAEGRATKDE